MRTSHYAFRARVCDVVLWQRIRMYQAFEVCGELGCFFVRQCNEQLVVFKIYHEGFKPRL